MYTLDIVSNCIPMFHRCKLFLFHHSIIEIPLTLSINIYNFRDVVGDFIIPFPYIDFTDVYLLLP